MYKPVQQTVNCCILQNDSISAEHVGTAVAPTCSAPYHFHCKVQIFGNSVLISSFDHHEFVVQQPYLQAEFGLSDSQSSLGHVCLEFSVKPDIWSQPCIFHALFAIGTICAQFSTQTHALSILLV